MSEVLHKLAGVSVQCKHCKTMLPFRYVEEKKSCSCGKMVELPQVHKEYFINKYNKVGHT